MSNILIIVIAILLIIIVFYSLSFINQSIIRNEQIECQEWLWMASSYPDFYWTSWQIDQCVAVEMYPI